MILQLGLFGSGGQDPTKLTPEGILTLLFSVVNIALTVIGIVAVVYIIIAGIQYVTAAGDEKKQAESKGAIQAAVIGIIIIASSFLITNTLLRQLAFNYTILDKDVNAPIKNSNYLVTPTPTPGP